MRNKYFRKLTALFLTLAVMLSFMPVVTLTASAASSSKVQVVTKVTDNKGDTVKYSYNKKGLVSKSVSKTTSKSASEDVAETVTTSYKYNKKNRLTRITVKDVEKETSYKTNPTTGKRAAARGTVTTTRTSVTTFKYNKKGLATKSVTTANTTKSGSVTSSSRYLSGGDFIKMADGRYYDYDSGKYYTASQVAAFAKSSSYTTTYKDNGNGSYTETYSSDPNEPETYKNTVVTTRTYKYDKKKRVKKETVSVVTTSDNTYKSSTSTSTSKYVTTNKPYVIKYTYGKNGRVKKMTTSNPNSFISIDGVYTSRHSGGTVYETRSHEVPGKEVRSYYINGKLTSTDTDTYKVYSEPLIYSSTFKYDKNGNLKSSKGTETDTVTRNVYDTVYDDVSVYSLNADGTRERVKTPVQVIYKSSSKFTTTVKNGTKRLLTKLGKTKSSTDGYPNGNSGSYSLNDKKFKLKAKKVASKVSKTAELQQWMIQNGVFSGMAGF